MCDGTFLFFLLAFFCPFFFFFSQFPIFLVLPVFLLRLFWFYYFIGILFWPLVVSFVTEFAAFVYSHIADINERTTLLQNFIDDASAVVRALCSFVCFVFACVYFDIEVMTALPASAVVIFFCILNVYVVVCYSLVFFIIVLCVLFFFVFILVSFVSWGFFYIQIFFLLTFLMNYVFFFCIYLVFFWAFISDILFRFCVLKFPLFNFLN